MIFHRERRGESERVTCAKCGREIAGRIPAGGDGTALYPRKHNKPDGTPCAGHRYQGDWKEDPLRGVR